MMFGAVFASFFTLVATVPAPRPISQAERAAVAVVSRYLSAGSEAVWRDLAGVSALRKTNKGDALREIEARLGPVAGTTWRLETAVPSLADQMAIFGVDFRSGAGDTIALSMIQENGAWKIAHIHTAAEPTAQAAGMPGSAALAVPQRVATTLDRRLALMIILPAVLLGILAMAVRDRAASRGFLAISVVSVVAGVVLLALAIDLPPGVGGAGLRPSTFDPGRAIPAGTGPMYVALADLVPLREAFAGGNLEPFESFAAADPRQRDVAKQWRAALEIGAGRSDDARNALASLTPGVQSSMSEILRARLAYLEAKDIEAVSACERAIAIGPGHDQLWLEAAEVLSILGFDERAGKYVRHAAEIGSRQPAVYYALAAQAGLESKEADAETLFLAAWRMQPVERSEVIGTPELWRIVSRPAVARVLSLHSADEPDFAGRADRPLELPTGTTAELSGNHLRLRAGGGALNVPGGASISPRTATIPGAHAWRRRREEKALVRFDEAGGRAAAAGAFADRVFRERFLDTAAALAERNRWADLVSLTDGLSARDERVPLSLMVDRGRALARLDRAAELRTLIRDLPLNPSFRRKKDPGAMRLVGELLAAAGDYDSAIAMLERARVQMPLPGLEQRVTQLDIERRLAGGYSVMKTAHFNLKYPPESDRGSIRRLAEILESEYGRLQPVWFPGLEMRPVTVNVLWWQDFRRYSESDSISGLLTNELFLPLAGLEVFSPPFVTIITHELAHAMLADASRNLAPRWFHEALALRLEMREAAENGFLKYRGDRYLSIALLDAVADRSVDPMLLGEARNLGESTLRFIESRFGSSAVPRMITAFRDGAGTAGAVRAATGMTMGGLDGAARAWGRAQPLHFEGQVIRYDGADRRLGSGRTR